MSNTALQPQAAQPTTSSDAEVQAALVSADDPQATPQERAEMLMEIACGLQIRPRSAQPLRDAVTLQWAAQLKRVVHDPFVFGVLRLHGIVRDPLEQRVRDALASVAPMLAEHGGGVELVSVLPPDTVEVRLTGSCQSCPSSGQTLSEGVERAIKEFAPEVIRVKQVRRSGLPPPPGQAQTIHFISPFAKNSSRAGDAGFAELCGLDELPPKQAIARTLGEQALLLYRDGEEVSCVSNACAHLGLTMDGGRVADGVIECPHHGFRYLLASGECLDVPEVQLVVHAVRVRNGRVAVKLGS